MWFLIHFLCKYSRISIVDFRTIFLFFIFWGLFQDIILSLFPVIFVHFLGHKRQKIGIWRYRKKFVSFWNKAAFGSPLQTFIYFNLVYRCNKKTNLIFFQFSLHYILVETIGLLIMNFIYFFLLGQKHTIHYLTIQKKLPTSPLSQKSQGLCFAL